MEILNLDDLVEAEVQPFEVHKGLESTDVLDEIIVEEQSCEVDQPCNNYWKELFFIYIKGCTKIPGHSKTEVQFAQERLVPGDCHFQNLVYTIHQVFQRTASWV